MFCHQLRLGKRRIRAASGTPALAHTPVKGQQAVGGVNTQPGPPPIFISNSAFSTSPFALSPQHVLYHHAKPYMPGKQRRKTSCGSVGSRTWVPLHHHDHSPRRFARCSARCSSCLLFPHNSSNDFPGQPGYLAQQHFVKQAISRAMTNSSRQQMLQWSFPFDLECEARLLTGCTLSITPRSTSARRTNVR